MTVELPAALVAEIIAAAGACPLESCGLLLGDGTTVTSAPAARNVSPSPADAFEVDPAALIAAHRAARLAGAAQVLGCFHTHPSGDPLPSVRDAGCAAPDGMLWLIATSTRARLWRAVEKGSVHGRFDPVRFDLRDGARIAAGLVEVDREALPLPHL